MERIGIVFQFESSTLNEEFLQTKVEELVDRIKSKYFNLITDAEADRNKAIFYFDNYEKRTEFAKKARATLIEPRHRLKVLWAKIRNKPVFPYDIKETTYTLPEFQHYNL